MVSFTHSYSKDRKAAARSGKNDNGAPDPTRMPDEKRSDSRHAGTCFIHTGSTLLHIGRYFQLHRLSRQRSEDESGRVCTIHRNRIRGHETDQDGGILHGMKGHRIPPHQIPFKANIWAMKELGVKRILVPTAVGSLKMEIKPGDLLIPDQLFDFTKSRDYTFYDGGEVFHVSLADPFCPELRKLAVDAAKALSFNVHDGGVHVCVEGPRYSTRAESLFFKNAVNGSTLNMTVAPECALARELEMCYVPIAMVTDYDVWGDFPVTSKEVVETANANVRKARAIIEKMLTTIPNERKNCKCGEALKDARA